MKPKKLNWKNATEEEREFLFFNHEGHTEQIYKYVCKCLLCGKTNGSDFEKNDLCNYPECKRKRLGWKKTE